MTGRRWFEHQALPVVAAVAVAVGLYVWRGGHYPLPVDLMALTAMGLFVYMGVRQLALSARFRNEDTKENDPMTDLPIAPRDECSSSAGDPAQLEELRAKLDLDGQPSAGTWSPVTVSSTPTTAEESRNRWARDHKTRAVVGAGGTVVRKLDIPTDLDRWHPNEIQDWMTEVEEDESVSEADIGRARKAVAHALGVDDDASAGA
ncbi:hypothetical protein [Streptomyces sp. V4I2]|uniref:hypothetical protein n=1 Tax=Streptomyces sp. V4I2 TaxID=3042280 RepID=UPI0027870355|nr:hypothetical protein [Streptomyces sp. V4I2]MDQ1041787.1 hypothetical protein [Streptomyces sp. V4I2]